jgi:DNA-binding MarR family transcriptional regulator
MPSAFAPEDRLVDLFDRLRKLAFSQHPLEDSSVTMPQLTLLDWIAASPGCGVQDIAAGLGLTAPTVSVSVRRLEKAGFLERQPDPQDGRAVRLFTTAHGQALCERARAFRQDKMRCLLKGLTAEEGSTLLTLLGRAISAAEQEGKSG